ncbi:MAG: hypothetical protein ACYCXW_22885 [Solirubrobacteraceae bacterium]
MRRDTSQDGEAQASRPGLSIVAAQLAMACDSPVSGSRSVRLGEALSGLARDLAAARREIAVLKRENAALRAQLELGGPGMSSVERHADAVANTPVRELLAARARARGSRDGTG